MTDSYVSVDLETTGLCTKRDKIIEIGAVRVQDGQIRDSFSCFVNPGRRLTEEISALTGIGQEQVDGARPIGQALPDFLDFAGELPLLGHRVLFDYSFLKRAAVNAGLSFEREGIDTLRLARQFLPELESRRLPDLCAHFGIPIRPHRALEDARAAHLLYRELAKRFYEEKAFSPAPLFYKVKKEGPATLRQKQRLRELNRAFGIAADYDVEMLTKNEASRLIDRILASHGSLQK
ncbi:MAG: 3'-5' exonuclease [Eubacteriales bacterium]|nr:3'-5' exonuclease [Eubacteriales bacterium]